MAEPPRLIYRAFEGYRQLTAELFDGQIVDRRSPQHCAPSRLGGGRGLVRGLVGGGTIKPPSAAFKFQESLMGINGIHLQRTAYVIPRGELLIRRYAALQPFQ